MAKDEKGLQPIAEIFSAVALGVALLHRHLVEQVDHLRQQPGWRRGCEKT